MEPALCAGECLSRNSVLGQNSIITPRVIDFLDPIEPVEPVEISLSYTVVCIAKSMWINLVYKIDLPDSVFFI